MNKFESFPHIEGFSQINKEIKKFNQNQPLPTIDFIGTVKAHGTNGSVILRPDNTLQYQSRNNILVDGMDNCGFKQFMMERDLIKLFDIIKQSITDENVSIGIYGEFCGKGVQKHVAISQVDKFFIIFGICIIKNDEKNSEKNEWCAMKDFDTVKNHSERIYNVYDFPTYNITIDFNNSIDALNEMTNLTNIVANECPIGKFFNITGMGEGIVWSKASEYVHDIMFKTKSEKFMPTVHTPKDKSNTNNDTLNTFIESTVSEVRLNQGIEFINETQSPSIELIGKFIKWVVEDILREEKDLIDELKLKTSEIKKDIGPKARSWYIKYLDTNL